MEAQTRSLSDDLRNRTDDELAALFAARPDLATPVPGDFAALAARMGHRASILRVLEGLDRFHLNALDAVVLQPEPVTLDETAEVLDVPTATVGPALNRLRVLGLVWRSGEDYYVPSGVRDALPYPAGLGPPARTVLRGSTLPRLAPVLESLQLPAAADTAAAAEAIATVLERPAAVRELLSALSPDELGVLGQLDTGLPVGSVPQATAPARLADARTPVRRLLAMGLLLAQDRDRSCSRGRWASPCGTGG